MGPQGSHDLWEEEHWAPLASLGSVAQDEAVLSRLGDGPADTSLPGVRRSFWQLQVLPLQAQEFVRPRSRADGQDEQGFEAVLCLGGRSEEPLDLILTERYVLAFGLRHRGRVSVAGDVVWEQTLLYGPLQSNADRRMDVAHRAWSEASRRLFRVEAVEVGVPRSALPAGPLPKQCGGARKGRGQTCSETWNPSPDIRRGVPGAQGRSGSRPELQKGDIGSALLFEAPYYKVIAGSFANADGAKEHLKAVRRVQPNAFIRIVRTDQGGNQVSDVEKAIAYAKQLIGKPSRLMACRPGRSSAGSTVTRAPQMIPEIAKDT